MSNRWNVCWKAIFEIKHVHVHVHVSFFFVVVLTYLVVMSPSRAEGFSVGIGLARDLFHISSELKNDWKTSWNFNSPLKPYSLLFSAIKLTKSCIYLKLFTFKDTKVKINDHDTGLLIIKTCGKNELKKFRFSTVSARKLKCPSSAPLGLEPSQLGSAQAGKFQLGLITTI